jgi:hypothetical protein
MKKKVLIIGSITFITLSGIGYYLYKRRKRDTNEIGIAPIIVSNSSPNKAIQTTKRYAYLFDKNTGNFIKKSENKTNEIVFFSSTNGSFTVLDFESELGYLIRMVLAEAGGVSNECGKVSENDRRIVAETIANRLKSGLYGNSIKEIVCNKGQFNAYNSDVWKQGIFGYVDYYRINKPYFFPLVEKSWIEVIKAAYTTYFNINKRIGNNCVSYVSCQTKKSNFDKMNNDPYSINITNQITGLTTIKGVWKRK